MYCEKEKVPFWDDEESILEASNGKVETARIFHGSSRSFESGGLYDERIFGPVSDYRCRCGKFKGIRYAGIICDRCGVELTKSEVRDKRFGHIELSHAFRLPSPTGGKDFLSRVLPVVPAGWRPLVMMDGLPYCENGYNSLYRRILELETQGRPDAPERQQELIDSLMHMMIEGTDYAFSTKI